MMDYILIATLIAASVSAVAAIWAAVSSSRQTKLMHNQSQRPDPIVEGQFESEFYWDKWRGLVLLFRNQAPSVLEITEIKLRRPFCTKFANWDDAMESDDFGDQVPKPEPPQQIFRKLKGNLLRVKAYGHTGPNPTSSYYLLINRNVDEIEVQVTYRWADQRRKIRRKTITI